MARQYLKLFTDLLEDPRISVLTDGEFRLVMTTWVLAKRQKPQGSFASMRHLRAITSQRLHRHFKTLLSSNLLRLDGDRVLVDNWSTLQVDPTGSERKQRFLERAGTETYRSGTVKGTVQINERLRDLETGETKRPRDIETKRLNSSNKPELIGDLLKGVLK